MKTLVTRLFIAALVCSVSGCAGALRPDDDAPVAATGGSSTTTEHTIRVDGVTRSYLLTVPDDIPDSAPLVVVLHGGFGSAKQARSAYGWDELAVSEGFAVAYPNGIGRAWNAGGGCCGAPGERDIDDVAFVEGVVEDVSTSSTIDASRVYATGMSNGAMMSYRLACHSDLFTAIAPVAGTLVGTCESPGQTSVLHIHGSADQNVRMDGAPGTGRKTIDGMAIDELIDLWTGSACSDAKVSTTGAVTRSVSSCSGGRDVELITIAGAGHQWPGSTRSRAQKVLNSDEPSMALDATGTIWKFFAAHP